MFRKRRAQAACHSCGHGMEPGTAFCPSCEQPTPWATYEQRVAFEAARWRATRPADERETPRVVDLRSRYPDTDALEDARRALDEARSIIEGASSEDGPHAGAGSHADR